MFSVTHTCKSTISVSSHRITGGSAALCLRTKRRNELHNPNGALPYWKIRERVNLGDCPIICNILCDDAFNFDLTIIVRGAPACRFNASPGCAAAYNYNHRILYIFARAITISNHTRKVLLHYREIGTASSAAASRGIGIREKHKRQASTGRGTFRCHCQPQQQAAIESVPLRNLGKWKQRGSESAFFFSPLPF